MDIFCEEYIWILVEITQKVKKIIILQREINTIFQNIDTIKILMELINPIAILFISSNPINVQEQVTKVI